MKGLRGNLDLPHIRLGLYIALFIFSLFVFILSCVRLGYTTRISSNDPLNGGRPFHDPVVAELLFTSLIAMPWSAFVIYSIHKRYENRWVSRFREELVGLGILWLFWMVGTAIATSIWPNLSWCSSFSPCQVLSALLAFCWLGWIALTALLVITLIFVVVNKTWTEPLHGKWDPRQTIYA
ncbi:hypothetical protein BKA70DRAFT_1121908 [Coprinopsis sp. MPI-PUGE-AT-0042]|nr:hypothetical protein BKA70DRAFT_1121908 [Coprinopsis sp. MPI-PUGE-AT-0042]